MKTCKKCGAEKGLDQFYRHSGGGFQGVCKPCTISRISELYHKNPGPKLKRQKELRLANPDEYKKKCRERRLNNLDFARAYDRKRRPLRIAKLRKYFTDRYHKDPTFKVACNLRSRINMALKGLGTKKNGPTFELLGCSVEEWVRHLESLFKPGMTWENHGPIWHIDHIKPCAKFDLTDIEQQKICFHWTNQQPLFAKDNMSKGAKYNG